MRVEIPFQPRVICCLAVGPQRSAASLYFNLIVTVFEAKN
jgi:hypothetical protein